MYLSSLDRQYSDNRERRWLDRYRHIDQLADSQKPMIPQGQGISYTDLSFGQDSDSLSMLKFNRILSFDHEKGTLKAEAGTTLGKVVHFLNSTDFYLPVVPGHPFITLGGCVAINAYGKGSFKLGLFNEHIVKIECFHPDKGYFTLTPQDKDWELVSGGFGLTGLIISLEIKLPKRKNLTLKKEVFSVNSFTESVEQLKEIRKDFDFVYSWHDVLSQKKWGRGYIYGARWNENSSTNANGFTEIPLEIQKHSISHPCLFNNYTTWAFNRLYEYLNPPKSKNVGYYDFSFPAVDMNKYFRLFGSPGFVEKQVIIPEEVALEFFLELEKAYKKFSPLITLASLKLSSGHPQYLDFKFNGFIFALDIPNIRRNQKFIEHWTSLSKDFALRPNFSKDSQLTFDKLCGRDQKDVESFLTHLKRFDNKMIFRNNLLSRLEPQ